MNNNRQRFIKTFTWIIILTICSFPLCFKKAYSQSKPTFISKQLVSSKTLKPSSPGSQVKVSKAPVVSATRAPAKTKPAPKSLPVSKPKVSGSLSLPVSYTSFKPTSVTRTLGNVLGSNKRRDAGRPVANSSLDLQGESSFISDQGESTSRERKPADNGSKKPEGAILKRVKWGPLGPEGRLLEVSGVMEYNLKRKAYELVDGKDTRSRISDLHLVDNPGVGFIPEYGVLERKSLMPFSGKKWTDTKVLGLLPMTEEMRKAIHAGLGDYYAVNENILSKIERKNYTVLTVHGVSGGWDGKLERTFGTNGRYAEEFKYSVKGSFSDSLKAYNASLVNPDVLEKFTAKLKEMRMLADARGEGLVVIGNSLGSDYAVRALNKAEVRVDILITAGSYVALTKENTKYAKTTLDLRSPYDLVAMKKMIMSSEAHKPDLTLITNDGHMPGRDYWVNPLVLKTVEGIINRGTANPAGN